MRLLLLGRNLVVSRKELVSIPGAKIDPKSIAEIVFSIPHQKKP